MTPIVKEEKQRNAKNISTKLPPLELDEIDKLIKAGAYLSTSDFIRKL